MLSAIKNGMLTDTADQIQRPVSQELDTKIPELGKNHLFLLSLSLFALN